METNPSLTNKEIIMKLPGPIWFLVILMLFVLIAILIALIRQASVIVLLIFVLVMTVLARVLWKQFRS